MRPGHPGWVPPSPAKSNEMRRVRTTGTAPETELRRRLHAAGLRFRVGYPVPGRPRRSIDIAFPRRRLAVFIDGCFWHGCPEHGAVPRTNAAFWKAKVDANRARDRETDEVLGSAGWIIVRIWEHTKTDDAAMMVKSALENVVRGEAQ